MSKEITTELVKELRDATGVSVMQCRNALIEAEGDMEKAVLILKKKSSDIALKKAGRDASNGLVTVVGNNEKNILLILHCETDFVAKNEDFVNLTKALAEKALNEGVDKMKKDSLDMINPVVQKVGEKIELGVVTEILGEVLGSYIHNQKSAVVVSLKGGTRELAKDIAMHIAAMKPLYMTREEISDTIKEQVKEMFVKEVQEIDKPEDIKQKMLQGKIDSYFKEQTLVDQPFIKNGDISVGTLLANSKATLVKFVRESVN